MILYSLVSVDLISAYMVFVCHLSLVCSFFLMCIVFCFYFFPLSLPSEV